MNLSKETRAALQLPELKKFLIDGGVKFNARLLSTVTKRLLGLKFEQVDEGAFKEVYRHRKFPLWVVKVHRSMRYRDCELNLLPRELRKKYLKPAFESGRISIQRKVKISENAERKLARMFPNRDLSRYDISCNNAGVLDGEAFIIDFLVGECRFGL